MLGLLKHIREVHPYFATRITCGLNGCPATPSSFEAFRRHIYRYHQDLLSISRQGSVPITLEDDHFDAEQEQAISLELDAAPNQLNVLCLPSPSILGAQFIMKTRDGKQLTQVTTDEIVQDTRVILQNMAKKIERRVLEKIESLEIAINDGQLSEIRDIFSDESLVNPFIGLETEYKQERFIQQHFNYVVSYYYYFVPY